MDIYEIADSIPAELAQVTLARILAELGTMHEYNHGDVLDGIKCLSRDLVKHLPDGVPDPTSYEEDRDSEKCVFWFEVSSTMFEDRK